MDYAGFSAQLALECAMQTTDPNFIANLPATIDYAEQRIYRELDLLNTVVRDTSVTLAVASRNFTIPNTFVVVNGINVLSPGTVTPDVGRLGPLTPTTRDYIDAVWTSSAYIAIPVDFAPITNWQFICGPAPDQAYKIEVVGTVRPAPLSASNVTSFLSLYLPDVFLAAAMVAMSGYMRTWGTQSSDPQMGMSWETQYKTLVTSAGVEEARKRYASSAWSSASPTPVATPPRS